MNTRFDPAERIRLRELIAAAHRGSHAVDPAAVAALPDLLNALDAADLREQLLTRQRDEHAACAHRIANEAIEATHDLAISRDAERSSKQTLLTRLAVAVGADKAIDDPVLNAAVSLRAERDRLARICADALPRERLNCPLCGVLHVDGADGSVYGVRPHHQHLCQPDHGGCGHVWENGRYSFGADVPADAAAAERMRCARIARNAQSYAKASAAAASTLENIHGWTCRAVGAGEIESFIASGMNPPASTASRRDQAEAMVTAAQEALKIAQQQYAETVRAELRAADDPVERWYAEAMESTAKHAEVPYFIELHNGCTERCDVAWGLPCACGAWHGKTELRWRLDHQRVQGEPVAKP